MEKESTYIKHTQTQKYKLNKQRNINPRKQGETSFSTNNTLS